MKQTFPGKSFQKFRFTSRGCPFFWKFGNSGNFLFHLAFLPGMNMPQFLSREKLQDGSDLSAESTPHWMQNNVPQFEPVLDCLFSTFGSDFLQNCRLVVPNFLRFSSLGLHTSRAYFPTRKVRKLLSSRENGV